MKIREPLPHWNNFTIPDLKQILRHCKALEELGIAQDKQMIASIERDIALRENQLKGHFKPLETQTKPTRHTKQPPHALILEQTT